MSADNLTTQYISSTYQRLLQLSENGNYITDGTGSVVSFLFTTSSHALTASYVPGVTATTPGGNLWSIQFNSASTFQGSSNLTFDNDASVLFVTGTIQLSGSAAIQGVNYIDFDTNNIIGTNAPAWKEGRLFYDSGSGALAFYNWEQEVTLNIGQEQWLRARNDSGQVVPNGTPVRITGAAGDKPNFDLAQAVDQVNTFSSTNDIIGVTTQEIGIGETGFVTTFGIVNGLDTQDWSAGDILWVSQSAGELTNVAPQAPYDKIFVGIVTRVNPNNGSIFVRCEPPFHFHDISSVSASAYTYGDLWMFKAIGSSGVWTNTKTLSGSYTFIGDQSITGSLNVTAGITGSLFGTASYADRAFRSTELGEDLYNLDVFDVGYGLGGGYTDTITLVNIASNVLSTITIDNVQNAANAGTATTANSVSILNQTVVVSGSIDISGSLYLNGVAVGSSGTETDPVYTAEKPTLATTGSNVFKGDQVITGSLDVTGSFGLYSFGATAPITTPNRTGLFYFNDTDLYISLE